MVMPKKPQPGSEQFAQHKEMTVLKMGRGHDSEIRVCDISVSRCHTLVKFNWQTSSYFLEDNLSKFGTLISSKESDIELLPNLTKAV